MVIVGASLAGAKAAEALREDGYDGRVVLIGAEAEQPYERPPLSKYYLRGEQEREKARVHEAGFYAEKDIELRTATTVETIHPAGRTLMLAGGETIAWDGLLLATGAEPRRIPVPGADLDGVLYLRTLDDSDRLRAAIAPGGRLAVIGAGWIGAEAAASARRLGAEVTMIERLDVPLELVLGTSVGRIYADAHREQGVELLTGVGVEAIEGAGRAERVRLSDGRSVECSAVLVGVGVAPRTALAAAAGLAVDNGILVDANLQSSAPGIYAAGDVANHDHPFYGRRIRVEHWANALNQGPAAARNMLGAGQPYERLPYFYSDQYDLGMEYSGLASGDDQVVIRGSVAKRELIAFWMRDGRVLAGMSMNIWDVTGPIQELIRSRATVDPDRLRDEGLPLEDLIPSERPGAAR